MPDRSLPRGAIEMASGFFPCPRKCEMSRSTSTAATGHIRSAGARFLRNLTAALACAALIAAPAAAQTTGSIATKMTIANSKASIAVSAANDANGGAGDDILPASLVGSVQIASAKMAEAAQAMRDVASEINSFIDAAIAASLPDDRDAMINALQPLAQRASVWTSQAAAWDAAASAWSSGAGALGTSDMPSTEAGGGGGGGVGVSGIADSMEAIIAAAATDASEAPQPTCPRQPLGERRAPRSRGQAGVATCPALRGMK